MRPSSSPAVPLGVYTAGPEDLLSLKSELKSDYSSNTSKSSCLEVKMERGFAKYFWRFQKLRYNLESVTTAPPPPIWLWFCCLSNIYSLISSIDSNWVTFFRLKLPGLFRPEGCVRGKTEAMSFCTRPRNSVSCVALSFFMMILQMRAHILNTVEASFSLRFANIENILWPGKTESSPPLFSSSYYVLLPPLKSLPSIMLKSGSSICS